MNNLFPKYLTFGPRERSLALGLFLFDCDCHWLATASLRLPLSAAAMKAWHRGGVGGEQREDPACCTLRAGGARPALAADPARRACGS